VSYSRWSRRSAPRPSLYPIQREEQVVERFWSTGLAALAAVAVVVGSAAAAPGTATRTSTAAREPRKPPNRQRPERVDRQSQERIGDERHERQQRRGGQHDAAQSAQIGAAIGQPAADRVAGG